jgi:nitroimidazol reductase NimA-like FMN-containing flavoprotein (pyridoxamine 5'-phosphate oxidase superfamily)
MRRSDREISDFQEIEQIIRKADVCRIAFANDNIPYIVTMNFGYVTGPSKMLYFHCAKEGRKLEMMLRNSYVCFEMDVDHQIKKGIRSCDWGMNYSSVVGYGNLHIVKGLEERTAGLDSIMAHYGGPELNEYDTKVLEHTTILRLDIQELTGKIKI